MSANVEAKKVIVEEIKAKILASKSVVLTSLGWLLPMADTTTILWLGVSIFLRYTRFLGVMAVPPNFAVIIVVVYDWVAQIDTYPPIFDGDRYPLRRYFTASISAGASHPPYDGLIAV